MRIVGYLGEENKICVEETLGQKILSAAEWCIANGSKDPAIHNYLISLYVQLPDDAPLLQ